MNRGKNVQPFSPADFMPTLKRYEQEQKWERQLAQVMVMNELAQIRAAKQGASK